MNDEPIIRPIEARPSKSQSRARQPRSLSRDVDMLVCMIAGLTALATFGLSAYFFYGFTQTDQSFWTLASAVGLCFGVGGLAFVPSFMTAKIAAKSRKGLAGRREMALALLLMLPWVCVALIFIGFSALPKRYGFLALCVSFGLSYWAFSRLRTLPKR